MRSQSKPLNAIQTLNFHSYPPPHRRGFMDSDPTEGTARAEPQQRNTTTTDVSERATRLRVLQADWLSALHWYGRMFQGERPASGYCKNIITEDEQMGVQGFRKSDPA